MVHGNDEKNLPGDFKKCPGSLHFTLLKHLSAYSFLFWTDDYLKFYTEINYGVNT